LHRIDDIHDAPAGLDRIPEQIGPPGVGLAEQRRDHPPRGGREEPAQRVVLAAGLFLGADDARVRAAAQPEVG